MKRNEGFNLVTTKGIGERLNAGDSVVGVTLRPTTEATSDLPIFWAELVFSSGEKKIWVTQDDLNGSIPRVFKTLKGVTLCAKYLPEEVPMEIFFPKRDSGSRYVDDD